MLCWALCRGWELLGSRGRFSSQCPQCLSILAHSVWVIRQRMTLAVNKVITATGNNSVYEVEAPGTRSQQECPPKGAPGAPSRMVACRDQEGLGPQPSRPVVSPSSSPVVTAACSYPLTPSAPDTLLAARCSMILNCRGGDICSLLAFHGAEIAVGPGPSPQAWVQHRGHQCPLPGAARKVLSAHRPLPTIRLHSHPSPCCGPHPTPGEVLEAGRRGLAKSGDGCEGNSSLAPKQ